MALDNLTSDLQALRNTRPRNFKDWLTWADPEVAAAVLEAVLDERIHPNQLVATLKQHDVPVTRETIIERRRDAAK